MSDFDRYATGYQLLDWLTAPYWHLMAWRAERRLDRALGITGSRQERREQRRELWQLVGSAAHIHTIPVDIMWIHRAGDEFACYWCPSCIKNYTVDQLEKR